MVVETQGQTVHQESLSKQAAFFEAGVRGLSAKPVMDDLKVTELKMLLLLARFKPGYWVALESIRNEVPVSLSTFSRSISKLSERCSLISLRKSSLNAKHKEIRLSSLGRAAVKHFASQLRSAGEPNGAGVGIPQTTKNRYLTGATALNIPSKEGTGDWHFIEVFQGTHGRTAGPFQVAGIDMPDTTSILGLEEVEDRSADLVRCGLEQSYPVFAASHYRAMTDLVYARLHDGKGLDSYRVDDWFPANEDQQKLREMLKKIEPSLSTSASKELYRWIKEQHLESA
jgi:hypothetical protein